MGKWFVALVFNHGRERKMSEERTEREQEREAVIRFIKRFSCTAEELSVDLSPETIQFAKQISLIIDNLAERIERCEHLK